MNKHKYMIIRFWGLPVSQLLEDAPVESPWSQPLSNVVSEHSLRVLLGNGVDVSQIGAAIAMILLESLSLWGWASCKSWALVGCVVSKAWRCLALLDRVWRLKLFLSTAWPGCVTHYVLYASMALPDSCWEVNLQASQINSCFRFRGVLLRE